MSVMNLTDSAVVNTCEDKCSLSFNYPNSPTCVITNTGNLFVIQYELDVNYTPVTFNNAQYHLQSNNIYLALPSIHQYNGAYTQAELLFFHTTDSSNELVCISIPINSNSSFSSPTLTTLLTDIVDYNINESGESNTITINNFTLNDIIPYRSYYYYKNSNVNYIAYGIENALYISDATLTTLSSYIANTMTDTQKAQIFPYTTTLLKNQKGPSMADSGEIYIDCQPVDSSTETSIYAFKKPSSDANGEKSNVTFAVMLESVGIDQTTIIILIAMSIVLLFYIFPMLYNHSPQVDANK